MIILYRGEVMAVGIIAEYNPFHNGHLYHLNEIKKMFPGEEIILVMSSSFTQRGTPSIINKWKKNELALKMGIDLVIELPYTLATESADYFSYGAITLLEKLKVDKFVFGSETNDMNIFDEIASAQIHHKEFNPLTKIYMKMGENYPTALSKSLYDLTGKKVNLPNDLLGISYIKIIEENHYHIKPYCIKRKNNYHDLDINHKISSATSIREALKNKIDIKNQVPEEVLEKLDTLHFEEDYFKFLKYKIMIEKDLDIYQTVDEGIGKKIKKEILNCSSQGELMEKIKSKRYTYNRIRRMLNHILCGFTKEIAKETKQIKYIRVLGFNEKGQNYLNQKKKEIEIPIISNFSKYKSKMMEMEFQASCSYASILEEKEKTELIKMEYQHHPKYKEKMEDERN